ncbi:VCBS repeat-containing protein [Pelagicoccus sp. SDUM812003]|uniref:FG-GAP repeat domain-containing protein n=1 Tax=Pelagicoccus sp. SDUM812003 TaxID=3041267 RepID=UPI0028108C02|nr:VCBS repeat-containing protein [Pelagicoccus sp. SDUM812003]MDQ8205105.1 VCBS repeat-containing protein [Pelagicoccus sp. SDUM812003]
MNFLSLVQTPPATTLRTFRAVLRFGVLAFFPVLLASGVASIIDRSTFTGKPIGAPVEGMPWITDLTIADLDQDGRLDVIACEGKLNLILWLRQTEPGVFEETVIEDNVAGPVHVEAVDFDQDGDIDLLISEMGIVTPNDQQIGTVTILENRGDQSFEKHEILKDVWRVNDLRAGDLDGDGDLDLVAGQFGYFQGEVQWLENLGGWTFKQHPLLDLAGTVHSPIGNIDGDGDLDIVALISQDWEEVHCLVNDGSGTFDRKILSGSTNRDFGSSGLTLADLDLDGDLDIVYTNGDGFDYATPGSRPWHGMQWLENLGDAEFEFHRIGDQGGIYSPTVVDIDNDGDNDVVACVWFGDWADPQEASLLCFENVGENRFEHRTLASSPTHLVVVDAADIDADGQIELVTGAFHFYPPYDRLSRITLWDMESAE